MDAAKEQRFDLLISGGHVIDPAKELSAPMDMGIAGGLIAALLPPGTPCKARKVIDAKGLYVIPGLIDMHCHIYPRFPVEADGLPNVNAEAHMFAAGVTTAVDAGTCGWRDFARFKQDVIDRSPLRILSFINIASGGMVNLTSEQTPADFHPKIAAAILETFPQLIVGIKAAHYWGDKPFDEAHPPWASVDAALEAAELCGGKIMVDFKPNPPECSYQDLVLKKMRPGDIHTHMYAQQFPILDENGKVNRFLFEARERGIHFDLGHGAGSFWFRNAVPALEQCFYPDTLSSDLYMGNVRGPVINLLHIMSKYASMGMKLEEVIARATILPARAVGHPELGSLDAGSCADIALVQKIDGPTSFADCGNARMAGNTRLQCALTLRAGQVMYDPSGLSMPDWRTAPEAYWTSPGVL